jgi:hypothetical protein
MLTSDWRGSDPQSCWSGQLLDYLVGALHGFGLNRWVQRWLNAQAAPSGALHLVWRAKF